MASSLGAIPYFDRRFKAGGSGQSAGRLDQGVPQTSNRPFKSDQITGSELHICYLRFSASLKAITRLNCSICDFLVSSVSVSMAVLNSWLATNCHILPDGVVKCRPKKPSSALSSSFSMFHWYTTK